jgi:hypothetical protein
MLIFQDIISSPNIYKSKISLNYINNRSDVTFLISMCGSIHATILMVPGSRGVAIGLLFGRHYKEGMIKEDRYIPKGNDFDAGIISA